MEPSVENPVSDLIAKLHELDRHGVMLEPVTKYELVEAILILANLQLGCLNLTSAMRRKDEDEVKKFAHEFASQLASAVEAAIRIGGAQFLEKLAEGMDHNHEPG